MERFDPLGIGATTGRPDIFTGELHPGYEVTLLRKHAIELRHRELYGNESAFLERATRQGLLVCQDYLHITVMDTMEPLK